MWHCSKAFPWPSWFTPLEGLAGGIFRGQRDGVDLDDRGKPVKRGPLIAEDDVWPVLSERRG